MAELKTKRTSESVSAFLDAIEDPGKRADAKAVSKMMREATGSRPARLGKYKTGKACLYVKSLEDVDRDVLRKLIDASVEHMRDEYEDTG